MEKEKFLILNRWRTPDGTILTSIYRHEYVEHTDKNGEYYFVDGGTDYIRMSVNNEKMTDMCVYSDSPFDEIRRIMVRGTFSEDNKPIFIPLCNMSNPHLENCIIYYSNLFDENGCKNKYMQFYLLELISRWYANKFITDKTYTIEDTTTDNVETISEQYLPSIEDVFDYGILETVTKIKENISTNIHSDKKETMELIIHLYNLLKREK
jgi:hypothetical protein